MLDLQRMANRGMLDLIQFAVHRLLVNRSPTLDSSRDCAPSDDAPPLLPVLVPRVPGWAAPEQRNAPRVHIPPFRVNVAAGYRRIGTMTK